MDVYDVLILGSGPAGGTAAIYAARANLKTLLLSGPTPGGQLTTTSRVENFPGFPDGIEGTRFGELLETQARQFGAEFRFDVITSVDFSQRPFLLKSEENEYRPGPSLFPPAVRRGIWAFQPRRNSPGAG